MAEEAMELKESDTPLKRLQGKRLVVLMALVALVICVILGYVFFKMFLSRDNKPEGAAPAAQGAPVTQMDIFYDMDEIIVNLTPTDNQKHYLKIIVSLRLGNLQDKEVVVANLSVIQDSLHTFLKELRSQDFSGSGATLRLKEEVMKRINKAIYPVEAKDVLFKEILVD